MFKAQACSDRIWEGLLTADQYFDRCLSFWCLPSRDLAEGRASRGSGQGALMMANRSGSRPRALATRLRSWFGDNQFLDRFGLAAPQQGHGIGSGAGLWKQSLRNVAIEISFLSFLDGCNSAPRQAR